VALGAENFVPWEKHLSAVRLIKKLKKTHPGIQILALENRLSVGAARLASTSDSESRRDIIRPLNKFKPKFPLALILGEEVGGINKKLINLCDQVLEIPMRGQKESLNVSVAFGVAAYELSKNSP